MYDYIRPASTVGARFLEIYSCSLLFALLYKNIVQYGLPDSVIVIIFHLLQYDTELAIIDDPPMKIPYRHTVKYHKLVDILYDLPTGRIETQSIECFLFVNHIIIRLSGSTMALHG